MLMAAHVIMILIEAKCLEDRIVDQRMYTLMRGSSGLTPIEARELP